MTEELAHKTLIVGGSTGGITVAARLCDALKNPDVAIIEPSRPALAKAERWGPVT